MKHWILTLDRAQTIIHNLDHGLMKLRAAKTYYSAYGVEISGRTKEQFIKNLCKAVKENTENV